MYYFASVFTMYFSKYHFLRWAFGTAVSSGQTSWHSRLTCHLGCSYLIGKCLGWSPISDSALSSCWCAISGHELNLGLQHGLQGPAACSLCISRKLEPRVEMALDPRHLFHMDASIPNSIVTSNANGCIKVIFSRVSTTKATLTEGCLTIEITSLISNINRSHGIYTGNKQHHSRTKLIKRAKQHDFFSPLITA